MNFIKSGFILLLLVLPFSGTAQLFTSKAEDVTKFLAKIQYFHPLRMVVPASIQTNLDLFEPSSVGSYYIKSVVLTTRSNYSNNSPSETIYQLSFDSKGRVVVITVKDALRLISYWECSYDDDVYGKESSYTVFKDQEPFLKCESTYGQTGKLVHKNYNWERLINSNQKYVYPVSQEMFSYDGEGRMAKYIFQHENQQQTIQLQFSGLGLIPEKRKEITKSVPIINSITDWENDEEIRKNTQTNEMLLTYSYEDGPGWLSKILTERTGNFKETNNLYYWHDEKGNLTEQESKGVTAERQWKSLMSYDMNGRIQKLEYYGPGNVLTYTNRMEYKLYQNGDLEQWTDFITSNGTTRSNLKYNLQGLLLLSYSDNSDMDPVTKAKTKSSFESIYKYTYWK